MSYINVRKLRDRSGYSQEYVASVLGVAQNTYSKIESGQSPLTIERAKKLADLFEVEPEYFFSDQEIGVVNHNNGNDYKLIFNPETYIEGQKEVYDLLLEDKDNQISYLKEEVEKLRNQLNDIYKHISNKL